MRVESFIQIMHYVKEGYTITAILNEMIRNNIITCKPTIKQTLKVLIKSGIIRLVKAGREHRIEIMKPKTFESIINMDWSNE